MKKAILGIFANSHAHWVGDGFPVRTLFSYDGLGQQLSPFLLLDYAGPAEFAPADAPRGVGEHPHRGFETVTIVYQGEVAHRDSAGNAGIVGAGDVQWMTAASGVLHEEFHSPRFTRSGGALEMVQLWVNLPAAHKMSAPRYQTLLNADIPTLESGGARIRVIAGGLPGARGPAKTVTPLDVWDVRIAAGESAQITAMPGRTAALAVLQGEVTVNGSRPVQGGGLIVLERRGEEVRIEAHSSSTLVWLSGEPIAEPIVGQGPFVMNSAAEIRAAMQDFRDGKFGLLSGTAA